MLSSSPSPLMSGARLIYCANGLFNLPTISGEMIGKLASKVLDDFGSHIQYGSVPTLMGNQICLSIHEDDECLDDDEVLIYDFSAESYNPLNLFSVLFGSDDGQFQWGFDYLAISRFCATFAGTTFHTEDVIEFTRESGLVYPNTIDSFDGVGLYPPREFIILGVNILGSELTLSERTRFM